MSSQLAEDVDFLRNGYRMMLQIREFEAAAIRGLEDGLVLGPVHPYVGEEAIATGVCSQLRSQDLVLSTHRGHGHTLAKGASPLKTMAEIFGRESGYCSGKGGSMHVADFSVGMLGANGVVGANITIAAGAGHAIKLAGDDRVVACFFGDGGVNRGPFLEGLNWAKVFSLPVLYICENNQYSAWTRTRDLTAGKPVDRARSLEIPAVEVDGNDLVAVAEAARDAVSAIRTRGGPFYIQANTYRLLGHTGADPDTLRDRSEIERQWQDEPIGRVRQRLLGLGVSAQELDKTEHLMQAEMSRVYAAAAAAPYPASRQAYADVQDVGDPTVEAF